MHGNEHQPLVQYSEGDLSLRETVFVSISPIKGFHRRPEEGAEVVEPLVLPI